MRKARTLLRLSETGVIAVLRAPTPEEAIKMADALIAGGVYGIELTFSTPHVERAVAALTEAYRERPEVLIGVGTVLDAISARIAILAGATFIVSPSYDAETMALCNMYQIPYIPGCMTITEMIVASKAGAEVVKLFPGSAVTPSYIQAIKAPLPQLSIMPTGGVNLENMSDWLDAGAVAVGIGGALSVVNDGNYEELTRRAQQYRTVYMEWRDAHED